MRVLLEGSLNLDRTGTSTKQRDMSKSIDRISSPSFGRRDPETDSLEAWISGSHLQPDFLVVEREPELRVGRDMVGPTASL